MSIDLSRVTGISDSRGVITEIKDSLGRVIWAVSGGKVILEVEKITSDTYAGETTYTGESFILLNIYPKTNGTVKVTYGGLTKTITDTSGAAEPNAQKVFFGTFNGVSDSVTTPASGTLTIKGDYQDGAFSVSSFNSASKKLSYCGCIVAINDWGSVRNPAVGAFCNCESLATVSLPNGITTIRGSVFQNCTGLTSITIPNSVTSIGANAFYGCSNLVISEIPNGITSIGDNAFAIGQYVNDTTGVPTNCAMYNCTIILPSTVTDIGTYAFCYTEDTNSSGGYFRHGYVNTVRCLATTPPTMSVSSDTGAFGYPNYRTALKKIIVPNGCGNAYKSATGWSEYASMIVEE